MEYFFIGQSMLCPCGSGKFYVDCCEPYHKGLCYPETALVLMRSRYSAYSRGEVDYIITTTHPKNPSLRKNKEIWRSEILNFCISTKFERLEILDFQPGEPSFVTFIATLSQNGQDVSFKEKSRFETVGSKWLYHSGIIMVV